MIDNSTSKNSQVEQTFITLEQQKSKAKMLLSWFLLTMQVLMLIGLGWLSYQYIKVNQQLEQQRQSHQILLNQIHDIDDALINIRQQSVSRVEEKNDTFTQSQLELLNIQLQIIDLLLEKGDYTTVKTLLTALDYQISHNNQELNPAFVQVLHSNLQQDIARITQLQSQPNAWQMQTVALMEVQKFLQKKQTLFHQEHMNHEKTIYIEHYFSQLMITINFAMQACQAQQVDLFRSYLQQANQQLDDIVFLQKKQNNYSLLQQTDVVKIKGWLTQLVNNPPKNVRTQTRKVLNSHMNLNHKE